MCARRVLERYFELMTKQNWLISLPIKPCQEGVYWSMHLTTTMWMWLLSMTIPTRPDHRAPRCPGFSHGQEPDPGVTKPMDPFVVLLAETRYPKEYVRVSWHFISWNTCCATISWNLMHAKLAQFHKTEIMLISSVFHEILTVCTVV